MARHRRHHPGRAGRGHPVQAVRRAGGAGRPGHRQDRGRAAPGGVPALHLPRAAGPPRRAGGRAEPDVPALHRPGAAVAGGDRRGARHRRAAVPRRGRAPRASRPRPPRSRAAPRWPRCSPRRCATGSGCRAGRSSSRSSSSGCALDRDTGRPGPHPGPALPQAAQRGQADLPPGGGAAARRAGRRRPRRPRPAGPPATSPTSATSCAESRELTRELDALWPTLSAEQLLTDLFADRRRLDSVARRLPAAERDLLVRPAPAETCPTARGGPRPTCRCSTRPPSCSATTAREAAGRRPRRCARRWPTPRACCDVLDLEEDLDPELLRATDVVDADRLAERQRVRRYDSTAERAAADREWTYGHVIVDEAQELSPMAWRLIMRRCPSRSMTMVGDIAQTGDLAGASSWGEVLSPYVANRWRLEQLTVNYRTPAEIADVADDVLAAIDPALAAAALGAQHRGAAAGGPVAAAAELDDVVAKVLAEEAGAVGDGRTAVLVPGGPGGGAAGAAGRGARGAGPGHPRRPGRPGRRPDLAGGGAADQRGQGPGVRRGRAGRAGGDPGREPARGQRPLRRADPRHPAAGRAARGAAAGRCCTGSPAEPDQRPMLVVRLPGERSVETADRRAGREMRDGGAEPAEVGHGEPQSVCQHVRTAADAEAISGGGGSVEPRIAAAAIPDIGRRAVTWSRSSAEARPAARKRYVHSWASRRVSQNTLGTVGQRTCGSASASATTAGRTRSWSKICQ